MGILDNIRRDAWMWGGANEGQVVAPGGSIGGGDDSTTPPKTSTPSDKVSGDMTAEEIGGDALPEDTLISTEDDSKISASKTEVEDKGDIVTAGEAEADRGAVFGEEDKIEATQITDEQLKEAEGKAAEKAKITDTALEKVGEVKEAEGKAAEGELSPGSIAEAAVGKAASGKLSDESKIQAAIGDLPQEATVAAQMAALTKGMETGEIPVWAKGTVEAAESAMAARGLSRSSMGAEAFTNAILQAAMPMAQADAAAHQAAFALNLNNEQQARLANAQASYGMDIANLNNEQQMVLSNLDNQQQANLVNAQSYLQLDIENLNNEQMMALSKFDASAAAEQTNAQMKQQALLEDVARQFDIDMKNLDNDQQMAVLNADFKQRALMSNNAQENAAKQFNASSEQQAKQFNASLITQVDLANKDRATATDQFNAGETNANARFEAQLDAARKQFNTEQANAIAQSNAQWRRQANLADTAAQNEANRLNTQNKWDMDEATQDQVWQQMRDEAHWSFKSGESAEARKNQNSQNELDRDADFKQAQVVAIIRKAATEISAEATKYASEVNAVAAIVS